MQGAKYTACATSKHKEKYASGYFECIHILRGYTLPTSPYCSSRGGVCAVRRVRRPIRKQVPCRDTEAIYECFTEKVPLVLVRKINGGKADALNMGINAARFPYFICMDADSVLQVDSLIKITRPVLEDDGVVAVGGVVRPCNDVELEGGRVKTYRLPKNLVACMQVVEYDRSFLGTRVLFDSFNGSLIISGAFGLFKKEAVIAIGGYDTKTMGEDMELVCLKQRKRAALVAKFERSPVNFKFVCSRLKKAVC